MFRKIIRSIKYRYEHKIKYILERHKFRMRYRKSAISRSVKLQHPECISLDGYVVLGEGTKLLCTKDYTSGAKPQHLQPHISIGNNFHSTRNLTIQCAGNVTIGENVLVASDVFIIDYNHGMNAETANYLDNPLIVCEVAIGDGTWIGNNAVILPGVHIGKKCIIGGEGVVTKDIPDYSLAVGNPAKVIKKWDFETKDWIGVQ